MISLPHSFISLRLAFLLAFFGASSRCNLSGLVESRPTERRQREEIRSQRGEEITSAPLNFYRGQNEKHSSAVQRFFSRATVAPPRGHLTRYNLMVNSMAPNSFQLHSLDDAGAFRFKAACILIASLTRNSHTKPRKRGAI